MGTLTNKEAEAEKLPARRAPSHSPRGGVDLAGVKRRRRNLGKGALGGRFDRRKKDTELVKPDDQKSASLSAARVHQSAAERENIPECLVRSCRSPRKFSRPQRCSTDGRRESRNARPRCRCSVSPLQRGSPAGDRGATTFNRVDTPSRSEDNLDRGARGRPPVREASSDGPRRVSDGHSRSLNQESRTRLRKEAERGGTEREGTQSRSRRRGERGNLTRGNDRWRMGGMASLPKSGS